MAVPTSRTLAKRLSNCLFPYLDDTAAAASTPSTCSGCKQSQKHTLRKKSTATVCLACCGDSGHTSPAAAVKVKAKTSWKLNCAKLITGKSSAISTAASSTPSSPEHRSTSAACVCTSYRKMDEREAQAPSTSATAIGSADIRLGPLPPVPQQQQQPQQQRNSTVDHSDDEDEDCDETARQRRAREILNGIDAPPGFQSHRASNNFSELSTPANVAAVASINSHLLTLSAAATSTTAQATAAAHLLLLQSLQSGIGSMAAPGGQHQQQSAGQLGVSAMSTLAIAEGTADQPRLIIHSQVSATQLHVRCPTVFFFSPQCLYLLVHNLTLVKLHVEPHGSPTNTTQQHHRN